MVRTQYNLPEAGKEILDKLRGKGWNVYESKDVMQRGREAIIRGGPAEKLEIDSRYVLLPIVEDPRDLTQVDVALERVALRLNKQTPTISIRGKRYPWTGFKPNERDVKVNTPQGYYVSYEEFVLSLDSIFDASKL